jgi:hypothetical protein
MEQQPGSIETERLEAFIGTWAMRPDFPGLPPVDGAARVTFEWLPGKRFVVQRWEVPVPEAPDGIAVIGWNDKRATLLQHYFDSRGIARVYEMRFDGRVWELSRTQPDLTPLSFSQRFVGTLSDDGREITGAWEKSEDGATGELDCPLVYARVSPTPEEAA